VEEQDADFRRARHPAEYGPQKRSAPDGPGGDKAWGTNQLHWRDSITKRGKTKQGKSGHHGNVPALVVAQLGKEGADSCAPGREGGW